MTTRVILVAMIASARFASAQPAEPPPALPPAPPGAPGGEPPHPMEPQQTPPGANAPYTPLPETPPAAPGPPPRLVKPEQPAVVAQKPQAMQYVQLGGGLGGNGSTADGGVFAGAAVEVGYRVYRGWWVHGQVVAGESANNKHPVGFDGTLLHVRAGGDWRHRWFFTGVDVGYARERVNGTITYSSFVAGIRVGADLPITANVRVRPYFELFAGDKLPMQPPIGGKDYQGGSIGVALAYEW